MQLRNLAAVTAASFAALSLVPPTSSASVNGTTAQLAGFENSNVQKFNVFGRGGGRSGNKPKSTAATETATAFSATITPTATITTKKTTQASEATHTPDSDETAAIAYWDLTYDGSKTDCDAKAKLREKGADLISNVGSVYYPDWAKEVGESMAQWGNATACSGGSLGVNVEQGASMKTTAGKLVNGNGITAA